MLGPCVKYSSSISSTSALLTTPNDFSIVSRKADRLSTVQIKCSMAFVLFLILSGRLRHFQRRGVGDSCISWAIESFPCMARAWAQQSVRCNYHAGHVCGGAGERRRTPTVGCVSLRWAQCSSHKSPSRPQKQRLSHGLPWHAGTHKAFILCHPSFSGLQSCSLLYAKHAWACVGNQQREGSAGRSGAGDSVGSILPSESVSNQVPACGC